MTLALVHLTTRLNKIEIERVGYITGRNGIYAVPDYVADESAFMKSLRTGLSPLCTEDKVQIPASAVHEFSRPVPIGVYSLWKFVGDVYCAWSSVLKINTGLTLPVSTRYRPLAILYGPDVILYMGVLLRVISAYVA